MEQLMRRPGKECNVLAKLAHEWRAAAAASLFVVWQFLEKNNKLVVVVDIIDIQDGKAERKQMNYCRCCRYCRCRCYNQWGHRRRRRWRYGSSNSAWTWQWPWRVAGASIFIGRWIRRPPLAQKLACRKATGVPCSYNCYCVFFTMEGFNLCTFLFF